LPVIPDAAAKWRFSQAAETFDMTAAKVPLSGHEGFVGCINNFGNG